MRTLISWSTALSLFCSISVTRFAADAGQASVQWAAAGNAQAVQGTLAALVSGMGSSIDVPAAPVAVAGKAVGGSAKTAPSERLDPIVAWVLAAGKPATVWSGIADALGLGTGADLPVIGKGYKSDDGVIHAFQVSTTTGHNELMIYRKTADGTVDWRVTRAGQVIVTVRIDQDVHVVPNSQYADLFAQELAYWEAKVPKPSATAGDPGTN